MELKAINEVSKLLDEFGDSNSNVLKTQFSGIIKIETGLKILELIENYPNSENLSDRSNHN